MSLETICADSDSNKMSNDAVIERYRSAHQFKEVRCASSRHTCSTQLACCIVKLQTYKKKIHLNKTVNKRNNKQTE